MNDDERAREIACGKAAMAGAKRLKCACGISINECKAGKWWEKCYLVKDIAEAILAERKRALEDARNAKCGNCKKGLPFQEDWTDVPNHDGTEPPGHLIFDGKHHWWGPCESIEIRRLIEAEEG